MAKELNGLYEFGEYRLDAAERLLLRDGQPVPLTPKAFETLLALVRHGGHLMSKDELMKEVWSDAFVEEINVARNVWTLRKALGDDEKEHRYIETVPKSGYRFVAPVRVLDRAATERSKKTPTILDVFQIDELHDLGASKTDNSAATAAVQEIRHHSIKSKLPILFAVAVVLAVAIYLIAFRRATTASERPIKQTKQTRNYNPAAYEYYRLARTYSRNQNAPDNDAAITNLKKAIEIDPGFALAYAELAREYRDKAFGLNPQPELEAEATAAASKALELDPDLADVHIALGLLRWTRSNHFQHEAAVEEYRLALELDPKSDEAHHELAAVYNHVGLFDKAETESRTAIEMNSNNTGARRRFATGLLYRGDYQQGLAAMPGTERFVPPLWAYWSAWALLQLGRKEEAAARIKQYLMNYPQDEGGLVTSVEALMAAADGDHRLADLKIKRAIELGKGYGHFHHSAYAIGSAYALMNQREQAIDWLRNAADDGFPCYPIFERDPNLNNLGEDPNFVAFMKTLKERWEYYKANL